MAILPYRASMQRLMIKLLRIPERKDRLMSVRFKFQNAKTDQAWNSRIPESKGSSSFRILGWKERLRFEFPESKDWSSFEFPGCKDRAEIRIQGSSQDWYSGWRQVKKSVQDTTKWYRSLSSVRLHKNWRSLKLLWRHESSSSSSSMKEVERAQRLLNQESSTTFTSRKLKDLWHFPLMTAVWYIQLQNGMNLLLLLLQRGGESSETIESSKLKDLWLLLTPKAVWQIQLQIGIILFRNEVEKKLKDYYKSVKKAQRWLASSTVTGSMAPPKIAKPIIVNISKDKFATISFWESHIDEVEEEEEHYLSHELWLLNLVPELQQLPNQKITP